METKSNTKDIQPLTKKDFETDQDIRWCPGCGDYSVLATVQRFLPSLGIPSRKVRFCIWYWLLEPFPLLHEHLRVSFRSRTRAPTIATGIKLTNPDLSVWVITGDGDALSIGGNHILHLLRRNLNLNVLLFNNRIYGLTKGQYSPTSKQGTVTKSTPFGSNDFPVDPIRFALGAQGIVHSHEL